MHFGSKRKMLHANRRRCTLWKIQIDYSLEYFHTKNLMNVIHMCLFCTLKNAVAIVWICVSEWCCCKNASAPLSEHINAIMYGAIKTRCDHRSSLFACDLAQWSTLSIPYDSNCCVIAAALLLPASVNLWAPFRQFFF